MNVKKLNKLLAMTASDEIEEARTAAFMLCKMLREGNADLSRLASGPASRMPADGYVRMQRAYETASYYESLRKKQREQEIAERKRARERWTNKRAKSESWADWSKSW